MIEIREVDQSFRSGFWLKKTELLKKISFQIPKKSIFGFVGPNGAGKTTLIHLLVGIKRPAAGQILFEGKETHLSEVKRKIGYLPERPYFYQFLKGRELLEFFGTLSQLSQRQLRRRIPEVLEEVGMTHAAELELSKYSKGMLQRLGLAQALINNPNILFLDEPLDGLDPLGRAEVKKIILGLKKQGKTIFFNSHILGDVAEICDTVGIIDKGNLIAHDSPLNLSKGYKDLEDAFVHIIETSRAKRT
jgi:ABC-2 type transport system ATP-binding protein